MHVHYFLGLTEAAKLLGWSTQYFAEYVYRGHLPTPVAYIGKRPAWAFEQIQDYAKKENINLQQVAIDQLEEVVIEQKVEIPIEDILKIKDFYASDSSLTNFKKISVIEKNYPYERNTITTIVKKAQPHYFEPKRWTITPTYEGKWTFQANNHIHDDYYSSKQNAFLALVKQAQKENVEGFITPTYQPLAIKEGILTTIHHRYNKFTVLPFHKMSTLLEQVTFDQLYKKAKERWQLEGHYIVVTLNLTNGLLLAYTSDNEDIPNFEPHVHLLQIFKNQKSKKRELEVEFSSKKEQAFNQLKNFYEEKN